MARTPCLRSCGVLVCPRYGLASLFLCFPKYKRKDRQIISLSPVSYKLQRYHRNLAKPHKGSIYILEAIYGQDDYNRTERLFFTPLNIKDMIFKQRAKMQIISMGLKVNCSKNANKFTKDRR